MTPAPPTTPPLSGDAKRSYVRDMFTAIAPQYDLLNHLLSLNVDRGWRRRAVRRLDWERAPSGVYLDACAGTLDLAAELARRPTFRGRVLGADFAVSMLERGREKAARIAPIGADAIELPFRDETFDGATVGFGVRNLADLDAGLTEFRRVLRPGGRLVVLEFATPAMWPVRPLYLWYFRRVLPFVGRIVSKHTSAYTYLPDSVLRFPAPEELAERLARAGFDMVAFERLTMGIVAIHWGRAA